MNGNHLWIFQIYTLHKSQVKFLSTDGLEEFVCALAK